MIKLTITLLATLALTSGFDNPEESRTSKILRPDFPNKKNEQPAKLFLQKYNSVQPVVVLVDNVERSQRAALSFMQNLSKIDPDSEKIQFMLIKFNSSGVTSVLETSLNNRGRFESLLRGEIIEEPSSAVGLGQFNKTAGFFAVLNAAHLLPPNSGVLIFVNRGINDEALAQHALAEVKKKRIRVFVVWGGSRPSPHHEEALLEDLASHSNGGFFVDSQKALSERNYEEFLKNGATPGVSMILSRKNIHGDVELRFPVNSDVTAVHLSITPNITRGILITPKGTKIDVLDGESVARYAEGSFTKLDLVSGLYDVHLNTTTATTLDVGFWRFRTGNTRALYNVTIFAYSKITTNAVVIGTNATGAIGRPGSRKKLVRLGVTGDISLISNISFVNNDGQTLPDKVSFTLDKDWASHLTENIETLETNHKKEVNIEVENIPKGPFYVVVDGKDPSGHDFRRLSYVKQYAENPLVIPQITIQVGLGSELITQPGRRPQIYFEVTNNGNRATYVQFFCQDKESILLSMTPYYQYLSPQETATVRVTLITRPGAYTDLVTFTARGSEEARTAVTVDVGTISQIDDRTSPTLDYTFTSDCTDVLFTSCDGGTWTVEIKAKDTGSGLLQLATIPKGVFVHDFTVGTKEEVTGTFSESCCNPDLQLIAVDRLQNRRTKDINAYRAALGPGAIAAIVLGVLILILLIIGLVLLCRYWCRRRAESYDLPTYRGPAGSRRS